MLVTETPIPYGRQEISAADIEAWKRIRTLQTASMLA
jgi:hypothetical protein